ncbi:MAG: nucleotidyl transferase AbiEii/AbiGii toxin family protein [Archangium sp.]
MASRRRTARPTRVRQGTASALGKAVRVTFEQAIRALEIHQARYCVVGGIARGLLAESRSTTDVDFAVSVESQEEVDSLIHAMRAEGFVVREIFLKQKSRNVATARLTWKTSSVRADLLFETSGIEALVVESARVQEVLPGVSAPVVQRNELIAMKLIAGRDQDVADIAALMSAGAHDRARVEALLDATTHPRRSEAIQLWTDILRRRASRVEDLEPAPADILNRFNKR